MQNRCHASSLFDAHMFFDRPVYAGSVKRNSSVGNKEHDSGGFLPGIIVGRVTLRWVSHRSDILFSTVCFKQPHNPPCETLRFYSVLGDVILLKTCVSLREGFIGVNCEAGPAFEFLLDSWSQTLHRIWNTAFHPYHDSGKKGGYTSVDINEVVQLVALHTWLIGFGWYSYTCVKSLMILT